MLDYLLLKISVAWGLMALCVAIHAVGLTSALRGLRAQRPGEEGFRRSTWLFIAIAGWVILLHVLEITTWALLYALGGAIPDLQESFYFSAVTYTTTGYGDVVLPMQWRLVGGIEALTGILMCGWSTGFFFAVVSRMHAVRSEAV